MSNISQLFKILTQQKSCTYKLISINVEHEETSENDIVTFMNIHSKAEFTMSIIEIVQNYNILSKFDSYSASQIGFYLGNGYKDDFI